MAYLLKVRAPVLKKGVHRVTSDFGPRTFVMQRKAVSDNHLGIDLTGADTSRIDDVIAFADGVVTAVRDGISGYSRINPAGNYLYIDHGNGYQTRYLHLEKGSIKVKKGQTVRAGDTVGRIGATGYVTGAHLHFEVRIGGTAQDPAPYLSGEKTLTDAKPASAKTYTVKKGDSWWKISAEVLGKGSRYKELQALNPGKTSLYPGDVIIIGKEEPAEPPKPAPAPAKTYTVQKGDSWWAISKKILGKGSRYMELKALNPGKEALYPGDVIVVG